MGWGVGLHGGCTYDMHGRKPCTGGFGLSLSGSRNPSERYSILYFMEQEFFNILTSYLSLPVRLQSFFKG